MPNLRLQNVDKEFPGGIQAVTDFSIEIKHGEFIVLVGPSGCGKTTVLRMIAGLETITNGDMYIDDKRINDVAPADRDISMVFQNYALYGHMSVYQNMGFSQTIRHESADVIHGKVMETADIVELKGELNRFPKHLSGGQRQRVALGRSIVNSASIILMDEPLSNLDAKLRVQARKELIKLHQQLGNTFIYVTHDQIEAMTMADRIVVMNNGRILQIGTPAEVYNWPENFFVGGFIGSPPMNFCSGEIKFDKFVAPGMNLKIPEKLMEIVGYYSYSNIVFGIRPESFSLEGYRLSEYIEGKVVATEFLGDRLLVFLDVGGSNFIASLKTQKVLKLGERIKVYADMDQAHFFDPETETRFRQEGGK